MRAVFGHEEIFNFFSSSMFSVLWFIWCVAHNSTSFIPDPSLHSARAPSLHCPLFEDLAHYLPLRKEKSFWLSQTVTHSDSLFLSSIFPVRSCWGAGAMQHVFVFVVVTHLSEWPNMSQLFRDLSLPISLCCLHLPVHDSCYHPNCYEA